MRRLLAALRRRYAWWQLDREFDRHCRVTQREVKRQIGPYARPRQGLAATMLRVPPDERADVLGLLRRVDLGPGGPGIDEVDRLYDLLDGLGAGR